MLARELLERLQSRRQGLAKVGLQGSNLRLQLNQAKLIPLLAQYFVAIEEDLRLLQ